MRHLVVLVFVFLFHASAFAAPLPEVDRKVEKLFAELDDDAFAIRTRAQRRLIAMGVAVEPQIEVLLARKEASLEQQNRAAEIVDAIWDGKEMSWDEVIRRSIKAVGNQGCQFPIGPDYAELSDRFSHLRKKTRTLIEDYKKTKTNEARDSALDAIVEEVFRGGKQFALVVGTIGYRNIKDSEKNYSLTIEVLSDESVSLIVDPNEFSVCPIAPIPPGAIFPNRMLGKDFRLGLTIDKMKVPTSEGRSYYGLRLTKGRDWTATHDKSLKSAVVQSISSIMTNDREAIAKAAKGVAAGSKPLPMKPLR